MRVAIVGSRDWKDGESIKKYMSSLPKDSVIISGGARGVDTFAVLYATELKLNFEVYNASWDIYGKTAGIIRNTEIINNSDKVVAFWNGKSKGTKDTIDKAIKADNIKEILIIKQVQENVW